MTYDYRCLESCSVAAEDPYDPAQRINISGVRSASSNSVLTENCCTSCDKLDDSDDRKCISQVEMSGTTAGRNWRPFCFAAFPRAVGLVLLETDASVLKLL